MFDTGTPPDQRKSTPLDSGQVAAKMFQELAALATAGYQFRTEPRRDPHGNVSSFRVTFQRTLTVDEIVQEKYFEPHGWTIDRCSFLARLPVIVHEMHERIFPVPPVPDAFLAA